MVRVEWVMRTSHYLNDMAASSRWWNLADKLKENIIIIKYYHLFIVNFNIFSAGIPGNKPGAMQRFRINR